MTKHFASFRFDAEEGTLWRGAQQIPLTGKAASLLRCLLERAGSWVSKSAIMAAVWPDTHVQPDNVKVLVREIRQALGDTSQHSRFIKSAPGRGYSFIADVSHLRSPVEQPSREVKAPIFVNRGPELAALADALDAVRASSRRLVLISGEHGSGKTALCDAFVRTAHAAGPVRVCYGHSFDRELAHEPYYAFLDALIALDRRHPGLVPRILAQHAPSWLALFPQWVGPGSRPCTPCGCSTSSSAALAALSHDLPLDSHPRGPPVGRRRHVNALARLAESQLPSKLLIVGTCATASGRRASGRSSALLAAAAIAPRSLRLALGIADARARGALHRRALRSRMPVGDGAAVHEATGGNPFMMVNAIDSLVARRLVVETRADGGATSSHECHRPRACRKRSAEVVARHFDHLDPREREALEAAAAVGLEFTASAVAVGLEQKVELCQGACSRRWRAAAISSSPSRRTPSPRAGRIASGTRFTPTSSRSRRRCCDNCAVVDRLNHAREVANRQLPRKRRRAEVPSVALNDLYFLSLG